MSALLNTEGEQFLKLNLSNWRFIRFLQGTGVPEGIFFKFYFIFFKQILISVLNQPPSNVGLSLENINQRSRLVLIYDRSQTIWLNQIFFFFFFLIVNENMWSLADAIWMIHMLALHAGFWCSSKDYLSLF